MAVLFVTATRPFCALQEEVDAAFDIRVAVLLEMQLGDMP
jgi:hypothetical protein